MQFLNGDNTERKLYMTLYKDHKMLKTTNYRTFPGSDNYAAAPCALRIYYINYDIIQK